MRYRIVIDDQDAATEPAAPLTLTLYRDDDDGCQSQQPATIGTEEALIGNNIPAMLSELSTYWQHGLVEEYEPTKE